MHGKGEFLWADKRKYVGEYKFGKKHGSGVFYYKDGRKLQGNWIKGKLNGEVTYTSANGVQRVVKFSSGKEIKPSTKN